MSKVQKKKEVAGTAEQNSERKKKSDSAIAAILKVTGQKPMGLNQGTWPHIKTGALVIDYLIGGTPLVDGPGQVCPGYPCGRMIEVFGPESSGKTTLALSAIVQVQKAGGIAMFLDYENALHHGYAKAIGVDFSPEKLLYYAPTTLEEGMKMMYVALKQGVDLIVIDSVAAMVPQKELEKKLDESAAIGVLARAMANVLPKMVQWLKESNSTVIFLNQTRANISTGGGGGVPEDNTAGGKAVKFYASLRLKLTRIKSEIIEKLDPITRKKKRIPYGNHVQVKIVKNKMDGTQGHNGTIFIRFGSGVDEYISFIEGAVPRRIIVQSGASYTYGGETFRGRDNLRKYLMDNPPAFEALKEKVTEALISESPKVSENLDEDEVLTELDGSIEDEEYGVDMGSGEELTVDSE
jgi:recombination protein RecA